MARPTLLTPEVQAKVVEAAAIGAPWKWVAMHAGISENTLSEWLARGEGTDPDRPATPAYRQFANEVRRARNDGDLALVAQARAAAAGLPGYKGDWKAAQFLLSVRHPDTYARPTRIAGADGGAIKIQAVPGDEIPARDVVGSKVIEAAERFRVAG